MSHAVTVVDAHVHIHRSADVPAILDSALFNFAAAAAAVNGTDWDGVLMLAEMHDADWFARSARTQTQLGLWSIQPLAVDPLSVRATSPRGTLIIVAGRQIATAEGIEVLALATRARIPDGLSLTATVTECSRQDALVVLPWGAGKWLGRRGGLVSSALSGNSASVFVGDNGGRPVFWPEGSIFSVARSNGRPVLPGTDPLPLRGEEGRVGSFGFMLGGSLPTDLPGWTLRERLRSASPGDVHSYGRLQGAVRFFRNQTALRLRKGKQLATAG